MSSCEITCEDTAGSDCQNNGGDVFDVLSGANDSCRPHKSRQLNPSQQDSVSQIRKYMEQANAAEKAGDVQRAHNLASKALLLSDDLVKH